LLIPIILSAVLLLFSWSKSYPLSLDSGTDFLFNHVYPLYWASLAVFLGSVGIAAIVVKNTKVVLILCIAILLAMYSLYYFYPSLPGSDTSTFRGLTEYAATTGDLNPLGPQHNYYQWPGFFVFSQIVTSVTGLQTIPFEFIFFMILGVLYVTALYNYFASFSKNLAWAAIFTYFLMIYWFFNYQYAPFSLAMGLLFVLFMIETRPIKAVGRTILTLLICVGITVIHPFAIVFFISYALIRYLLGRTKYYLKLFAINLVIWLSVTLFSTGIFFDQILQAIVSITTQEYASSIQATLSNPFIKLPDLYFTAQTFSRSLVLVTGLVAAVGFVFILLKKRFREIDFALLISAGFYSLAGAVVYVLGQRAWFILFMPLSLGAVYFLEHKLGKYLKPLFVILLILFTFVPLSYTYNTTQVFFQTKNENFLSDFAITNYSWEGSGSVLAHFRLITYLESKTGGTVQFGSEYQFTNTYYRVFPQNIPTFNCIIYTAGLAQSTSARNYSMEGLWQGQKYNRVYDSGPLSYILVDSKP
jgi:hypothetical protein